MKKKYEKAMSQSQYLRNAGLCPQCRSTHISGNEMDVEGNYAFQGVSCLDCGASWRDVYVLDGYSFIEGGKP